MRTGLILLTAYILLICIISFGYANAEDFRAREISDKIFVLEDVEGGEDQLVITSDKGLVVFNSLWSEKTARKYKDGIARVLNRDDFAYTINTVDRLDMFGGNAAYKETMIIGQVTFLDKYKGKEEDVEAEIQQLIEMWRWKEDVSRERLENHERGSEDAINEERWMNTCKKRADELEEGFSLILPTMYYDERMALDLGNISLNLIWFGKAGNYNGITVVVIPEEKTAIVPSFILHHHHLAPYRRSAYEELDVPRWITVLEEILEGENPVEKVICDISFVWSRERALTHLDYIRRLWNSVKVEEAAGKDIDEIQDQLSLEKDFAFVKEMQVYIDGGDDWIRPQHHTHIRLFFLQHKNLASEIIKNFGIDSLSVALAQIRRLRNEGSDIYIEEASINTFGYDLLNMENFARAIEVFKLNVEVFPESFNVYDSYAEALMKSGDIENAILNYNKSLEINPDNANAREMLQTLEKQ